MASRLCHRSLGRSRSPSQILLIAVAAAVNVLVVYIWAPETKGRSLIELESGESRREQLRAARASPGQR
jgi:hypothetical protein